MARVTIAVVQSCGGLRLDDALASVRVADELLVMRLAVDEKAKGRGPGPPARDPGNSRIPSCEAQRVQFIDLPQERFSAARAEARARTTSDWLLLLDESDRIDATLAVSLEDLKKQPAKTGYFTITRKLDLFGQPTPTGRRELIESASGPCGTCLGQLEGEIVSSEADSFAGLLAAINARSTISASAKYLLGRKPGVWRMICRPLVAFCRTLVKLRGRGGIGLLIYAVAQGYLEIVILGKLWELEHRRRSRRELKEVGAQGPGQGGVASDYVTLVSHEISVTVVRSSQEFAVACLGAADPEDCFGEPVSTGGRGSAWIVPLDEGSKGVLRWYRRGGLVQYFMRDGYLNLRGQPRPLRELANCVEARRRGIRVPEVLGVRTDRLLGPFYRGAILTRWVGGAVTAWEAISASLETDGARRIMGQVLIAVERMHDGGIYHRDLNLNNILVSDLAGRREIWFIDFDRALVQEKPVAGRYRRRALKRMARSLAKLAQTCDRLTREQVARLADDCLRGQGL